MVRWLNDHDDPRVLAALKQRCPACAAVPGAVCTVGGHPVKSGVVHHIRIPQNILFNTRRGNSDVTGEGPSRPVSPAAVKSDARRPVTVTIRADEPSLIVDGLRAQLDPDVYRAVIRLADMDADES